MELVGPIFEVLKCFGGPTSRYIDRHKKLEENLNDLRRKVNDLNVRKHDLELRKEAEVRCRKVVKQEVDSWFEDVLRINTEVQKIEEKFRVVSYFSRVHLGELVCRKIGEVKEIYEQGSFVEGVAVDGPPAIGVTIPTTSLKGETDVKDRIWKYLMGDEVGMIGVCGMGGIGKTTIMKHINNQLVKESDQFEKVIWVTVSKDCKTSKLQENIANSLKLGSFPTDELERAVILEDSLEGKRFVLILDDVWEPFSLLDMGIPAPASGMGRKIVLTSRSIEVCRSMGCEVIRVQPLSREESMSLFLDHVGGNVLQNQELVGIVNKIVEQCAGLPLAIITIAGTMIGVNDLCEWRNALNELVDRVKSVKGSDIKIFECLKFSYDRLGDRKIQNCFLYCSLYPEDYKIEKTELIESWIDEGLLDGLKTRQAMYDRGYSILNKLENNCLLDSGIYDDKEMVKMHDVLRDMALYIKSNGPQFMVKAGMGLKELPDEHEWAETLEKVSLMQNLMYQRIPVHMKPSCPHLSTLLMQSHFGFLRGIPNCFFEQMPRLKVLNLSHSKITALPDSILKLKSLNSLILLGCKGLTYLPSLEELIALRKLDLFDTNIKEVPLGTDKLTYFRLKSLYLKVLPVGILSKMSDHLQCLVLCLDVTGKEIGRLRTLEILSCSFGNLHEFEIYAKSIQGKWPTTFKFQVGPLFPTYFFAELEMAHSLKKLHRAVTFINCDLEKIDHTVVPDRLSNLDIIRSCFKSLSHIPWFNKVTKLKRCYIETCGGIECVVDLSLSCNSFPNIEVLHLWGLENLVELVRGVAVVVESSSNALTPPAIFSSLKELKLKFCPRITKLFPIKLLQGLQSLEQICVEFCGKVEEIIASEEEEKGTAVVLPKLKSLILSNLEELSKICSSGVMIRADSLEYIEVVECPEVKRIPLALPLLENGETSAPPSLKEVMVSTRDWWESMEWDQSDAKNVLTPFVTYSCHLNASG